MGKMSESKREEFLAKTRYGYLTTLTNDGSPRTVPVWFDWDGQAVRIFTHKESPKVKRLKRDSRVTLTVSNEINEYEAWVAFDGKATVRVDDNIVSFLGKLASRYWDLSDPKRETVLEAWEKMPDQFFLIEWVPTRIRSYSD